MSHIGEEAIVTLSMKMEAFAIFITMKSIKGTGKIARNVETSSENLNSNIGLRTGQIPYIIKRRAPLLNVKGIYLEEGEALV